jgi:ribosomal protein S18 acetylase RimI-like enzyme
VSEIPLSRRVDAPAVLDLPADSGGLAWRHATTGDIDAIVDCEREIGARDHPHYVTPREEIADDFAQSYVDIATDTILALGADGTVLGWGLAIVPPGQDSLVRSILVGGVRPASRGLGIGRQLFAWQKGRGMQQLAASEKTLPGWLMAFVPERAVETVDLLEHAGLSVARYFLELRRDLAEPIESVAVDPGVRIESFAPEWSRATHASRDDAFRDHWGSQPASDEQWHSLVGREVSRADLSSIAIGTNAAGDEEVAGLVMVSVNEEDWPGQGFSSAYIDLVGVPRAWRKRGIASALITNTLHAVAAAGLERAVLDVDAESPTGALGLYTGLGFRESNRSMAFTSIF